MPHPTPKQNRPTPHRLLSAAKAAGWASARLEIDTDGKQTLIVSENPEDQPPGAWDMEKLNEKIVAIRPDNKRKAKA